MVVVGGGVGGVAAVRKLASAGLAVALVEDRLVGGECHYWACNPTRHWFVRSRFLIWRRLFLVCEKAISDGGLDVPAVFAKRDTIIEHLSDQEPGIVIAASRCRSVSWVRPIERPTNSASGVCR